jgi:TolA-binding protein
MIATDRPCPDDLVMRGHRDQLSQLERRVLDAHLGQCASCRAALAVARHFDAIPDTQPDDDRLIARVAGRAAKGRGARSSRRWLQAAAAAMIALGSGAATATWLTLRRHGPDGGHQTEAARVAKGGGHHAAPPSAAEATGAPQAPATEGAGESSFSARTAPRAEARGRGPLAMELPPPPRDAASLFAEANAVRRSGDLRRAIDLYRALRRQFPESSQARLASLSLGDLLRGLGDAAGALAAYDSYLAHASAGALTEEALFGRARCLARLGRPAEERQTWEELVHRYPRSAYRPAAERRLQELER